MASVRRRLPIFLAVFPASLLVVAETLVFALAPGDPSRGLPKGCYTVLERLFGLTPSSTRGFQFFLGLALVIGSLAWLLRPAERTGE